MALRFAAMVISFVFHPLLIVSYAFMFLLWINAYLFLGSDMKGNMGLFIMVFASTFLMPVFAVGIMRALNIIKSIEMEDKLERTGPFIATGVFYLTIFMTLQKQVSHVPLIFKAFVLGSVIALFTAFFINIFSKISLHTVGMGGFVALVLITITYYQYDNLQLYLLSSIIIAGLVGSSRLLLGAHHPNQVYGGYFVGFITQFIALQILL